MKKSIALVGATGAVGRTMLTELERIGPKNRDVFLFASPRSAGTKMKFHGKELEVQAFDSQKLKNCYVLMSAGGGFSKEYAPQLVEQNCIVIDNSSAWRMDPEVPLVVPEVNPEAVKHIREKGIIANPNCSTIQMVVSLAPLDKEFGLEKVTVSTYQSVSGAGQSGVDDLKNQILDENAPASKLPRRIAFDVIPAIDVLDEDGHCFEEIKMVNETRKILSQESLPVFATTVRVPTFYGHGESVMVELKKEASSIQDVRKVFNGAAGLELVAENKYEYLPTPQSTAHSSLVYVARLRFPVGEARSNLLQYWNVSNNVLKGAATNAVQILNLFE